MTAFHRWKDVKGEIFDAEDVEAINQGAAEIVAAARHAEMRDKLGLRQADVTGRLHAPDT